MTAIVEKINPSAGNSINHPYSNSTRATIMIDKSSILKKIMKKKKRQPP